MPAFTDQEIEQALADPDADPATEPVRQAMLTAAHTANQHLQPGHQASMWLAGLTNATAWATRPPTTAPAPLPRRSTGCCRDTA